MISRLLLAAMVVCPCLLGAASTAEADWAQMYIAPMVGSMYYRMFCPGVGMVEFRHLDGGNRYVGANGWQAVRSGDRMTVTAPRVPGQAPASYQFENGRPVEVTRDGRGEKVEAPGNVRYDGLLPSPMWDDVETFGASRWKGRLAWPYANPNRAAVLYLSLALIGLQLLLRRTRRGGRLAGCGLLVAGLALTVATRSRGGMLALLLGGVLMTAPWLKSRFPCVGRPLVRRAFIVLAFFALAFGLLAVSARKAVDGGDDLRSELWRTAPRMMVDAPGGWTAAMRPGAAYVNWYQPDGKKDVTFTLVSGHLTRLVGTGWFGRFGWLFLWSAVILVLLQAARHGGSPLPLALWTAFGLADVFNPVDFSWSLWILPLASLALWLASRPWTVWRTYVLALIGATLLSGSGVATLWLVGSSSSRQNGPELRIEGGRILVKGRQPACWVVDDGKTLGWVLVGKEIRAFYAQKPSAGPLGYVRRLEDLPERVDTLVIAGEQCRTYLNLARRRHAPRARKVVFVSPPFGPNAVPRELSGSGRFMMVLGEFAARYVNVYGPPPYPPWVGLVEGAELYIPGWVGLATSL